MKHENDRTENECGGDPWSLRINLHFRREEVILMFALAIVLLLVVKWIF